MTEDTGNAPLNIQDEDPENVSGDPERPKAAVGVYTLPAGYLGPDGRLHREIWLKEMTGVEEDIMSSRGGSVLSKLNQVMANCIERIGDITDKREIREIVKDLPVGDRNFIIVSLRRVSLGDEYTMEVVCTNPVCERTQEMVLDLSTMAVNEMPEPDRREFELELPSGKVAVWKVMTGAEEETLEKIREATEKDMLTFAVLMRLVYLDGEKISIGSRVKDSRGRLSLDKSGQASFLKVKQLSSRDRNALRNEFQEKEGGMEDEVEFECEKCGKTVRAGLDLAQLGFFFPSGA